MARPYVLCHMIPSLDGRIVTARWGMAKRGYTTYERIHKALDYDAWIIGRVSMEPYAGKSRVPARKDAVPIPRTDFVAPGAAKPYAIGIDPAGKLTWKTSNVDGEHAIAVLTEAVSDDYLAFLQARGVSYVFGGRKTVDLERTLDKLRRLFGIKRLALEGGGRINGHFVAANLIDELSVVVAPVLDGSLGTPTLVDSPTGKQTVRHLKLTHSEALPGGFVWLRYKVKR